MNYWVNIIEYYNQDLKNKNWLKQKIFPHFREAIIIIISFVWKISHIQLNPILNKNNFLDGLNINQSMTAPHFWGVLGVSSQSFLLYCVVMSKFLSWFLQFTRHGRRKVINFHNFTRCNATTVVSVTRRRMQRKSLNFSISVHQPEKKQFL